MSRIDSRHRKISTGRHFQNGSHNTAQIQHFPISTTFHMWVDLMSRIYSKHWNISSGRHFQYGRHNTAQIQHCPISSKLDRRVNNDVPILKNFFGCIFKMATRIPQKFNDVPNWFPTLTNFYRLPFSEWPPQYRTNSTLSDFNYISYVGRLWCPELIPFSKWPPQYCKKSTSFNFKGSFWFIF
jgi:hypothetical protein